MKTLKGRVIRANILMVLLSTAVVIVMSALLILLLSFGKAEVYGIAGILQLIGAGRYSDNFFLSPDIPSYWVMWLIGTGLVVAIVCTWISANLINHVVVPVKTLKEAAQKISKRDLEFEIFNSGDMEIDELGKALDEIRKGLRVNAIRDEHIKEERTMLLANLSHDLRTPIATIKGYSEGLVDGVANTEEKQRAYLETIYSKALVMEKLLDNMSEYSELELGRLQYVFEFMDYTSFLLDLCQEYALDVEASDISFSSKLSNEAFWVVGDRNKLKRVLDNLVSNAVKYNKVGGVLNISTQTDGKGVLTCISNSGGWIKKEELNRVFEGFYRSDIARASSKGSGLGLAIAKQILESHGGKIWIKSEEGIGTDVFLYLPLRSPKEEKDHDQQ